MDCPRCGASAGDQASCPRCGVVFAKLRERPQRAAAPAPTRPAPPARQAPWVALLIAALGLAGLGVWIARRPRPRPSPPAAVQAVTAAPRHSESDRAAAALPALPLPEPSPPPVQDVPTGGLSREDAATVSFLTQRLALRSSLGPGDVATLETLCARYPNEDGLRNLLAAVLVSVSNADRAARRFDAAAAGLRRAADLRPRDASLRLALANLYSESGDWPAAEAAAREALQIDPKNADALEALAFALFRQDRNREARDALREALDVRPNAAAQALLARIEKGLEDESGMTEQRVAHFDVRYDGEAHADVGREILRGLERHYATLVSTFDHTPETTIPVILFTQQAYYDAAGAPAWSGGAFDNFDGRIRIPVMGLTSALDPEIDSTLIHELTHAFIFDVSHGVAPRNLHEGVAQYMEGKRIASVLRPEQVTALADGRLRGVGGFYLESLSFAEYLYAIRGQGGINDALRAMGETGSLDQAFRRVYGQDYNATMRAWSDRLRLQHGS